MDDTIIKLIGVYGLTIQTSKHIFYQELRQAQHLQPIPWMIVGDFNVTLHQTDRSNQQHNTHDMIQFKNVTDSLELMDLQLQGMDYTWSNEQETPSFVRLDKFLISTK
jgi:exonuclease III